MLFVAITCTYMDQWDQAVGDKFNAEIKENNLYDRYAVAVNVERNSVSQVPREMSNCHTYSLLMV